ncbi:MAG: D-alanine--D-alanine ligase [Streptosporangiales bacterium]|nr:D-alanine--D-alanine ligase [Streptosporangiales bacterium]
MTSIDRVLVLAGGLSHEREVSQRSGRRLADALRVGELEVELRDVDARLLPYLRADPPDVVFPTLHGSMGEDGSLRDVLELAGVPYVGSDPGACRLAFDKPVAKTVVSRAGLSTPASVTLPKSVFYDLGAPAVMDRIVERLGLPLFIKPSRGGSALGASMVRTAEELPPAVVGCFGYGDTALIERYVSGTEVTVGVIDRGAGLQTLPPVEIDPDGGVYDYAARYTPGRTEFFAPARLDPGALRAAEEAAAVAHATLGLRDMSRTDLIVDADGVPHFLEVNVAPGLTDTSTLPLALAAAGEDLGGVGRDLLSVAATRFT